MEPFGLQPLCDYDDSMDALPSLWESGEFDSPMTGDLRGDTNLQQFEGLNFMSDKDGEDQDLAVDAQPLVILRDRLITDASMVDLLPANYNNKSSKDSPLLGSAPSTSFSVYVSTKSPSSLEINDDIKLNQGTATSILNRCDNLKLMLLISAGMASVFCLVVVFVWNDNEETDWIGIIDMIRNGWQFLRPIDAKHQKRELRC